MREILQVIQGAVASRDNIPVLTHFAFHNGRVYGYNGRICISAELPSSWNKLNFTLPAVKLITALNHSAADQFKWKAEKGKVVLSSGTFKVHLPTGDLSTFPFPELPPTKSRAVITPGLIAGLRRVRPFVGDDASRPWASSAYLATGIVVATNNVSIAEVKLPGKYPDVNIPVHALDELLRIGVEPTHYSLEDHALTFYLPGGTWIRSQLFEERWPDVAKEIIPRAFPKRNLPDLPNLALRAAVEMLVPFCPDPKHPTILFSDDEVRTTDGDMKASVSGFKWPKNTVCGFRAEPLLLVLQEATQMHISTYPRVIWAGKGIRGIIAGIPTP